MVLNLQVTVASPLGGSMYEAPRLVKYGQFRDLTQQTCLTTAPYTGKTQNTFDSIFPAGINDGCPEVRS
jgi:hypothetical protein